VNEKENETRTKMNSDACTRIKIKTKIEGPQLELIKNPNECYLWTKFPHRTERKWL